MAGHFTIDTDHARGLLRVTMSGFFSVDDVTRYHAAVGVASESLGRPPTRQVMTCDISEMQIQSQDIVTAFRQVMGDPRYRDRRVAFVVASTLARKQLLRIIGDRTVKIFACSEAAERWLFDPAAPAA